MATVRVSASNDSGNLLADFVANANAEMQGRLQVARILHETNDPGVRDMLGYQMGVIRPTGTLQRLTRRMD